MYPNFDRIASPDLFCEDAKNSFREFQANGLFQKFPTAALYVYRIETAHRKHTGIIALDDVADFFEGKIKKHEKTIGEREQQQMRLFLEWNAVLKPVLLTYPPVAAIHRWLNDFAKTHPPVYTTHFEKDGQTHRVWAVTDPAAIQHLRRLFAAEVPCTYIADGHHRTTTIALLHKNREGRHPDLDLDHLFCAFFAADQLNILDYNRVVEALKDINAAGFAARLSYIFDITARSGGHKPRKKHELVMYLEQKWYDLRWKKNILDQYPAGQVLLDASLLNELVMKDIAGITDVRTDTRIIYVEGARGVEGVQKVADNDKSRVGFLLHPVSFEDLTHIADAGDSLPPKSTYFEPRIKSGMLVKMLKG